MRIIDGDALKDALQRSQAEAFMDQNLEIAGCIEASIRMIDEQPTIEPEVRHGYWIECDYKHLEHGMIETEPNAGLCCSECRAAFQKKKMTYKQYCAACGARMNGGADDAKCNT